jgi:hypothetical protein
MDPAYHLQAKYFATSINFQQEKNKLLEGI